MTPIYVAAYHQSPFGKLYGVGLTEMVKRAIEELVAEAGISAALIDCGAVGSACSVALNGQGLLGGIAAMVPGLAGKPIEAVENACASGGEAVLSVVRKLLAGEGEVGVAVGCEKMRDAEGKMDGKKVGEALGYFSHPDERECGGSFVFPHHFAELMAAYMAAYGATEEDFAGISVAEYANARFNPYAQMKDVDLTLEKALRIEGPNRYLFPGLPLKTYDCSQISDGYAALLLATPRGLDRLGLRPRDCVRIAGWAQATDPLARSGRDLLRPAGARKAMHRAYEMAGLTPADVNVAEIHDCFSVMGAIGVEVLGKADFGCGTRYWRDGRAAKDADCGVNLSGGLIAKGHPVGATGVAMIGSCYWQLLGKAPAMLQKASPRAAATFNIGGPLCATAATILVRG